MISSETHEIGFKNLDKNYNLLRDEFSTLEIYICLEYRTQEFNSLSKWLEKRLEF